VVLCNDSFALVTTASSRGSDHGDGCGYGEHGGRDGGRGGGRGGGRSSRDARRFNYYGMNNQTE